MVVDSNCYQVMVHYSTFVEQLNPIQTKAETRAGTEMTYQRKVEAFLGEDNCYRISIVSVMHFRVFRLFCLRLVTYGYL